MRNTSNKYKYRYIGGQCPTIVVVVGAMGASAESMNNSSAVNQKDIPFQQIQAARVGYA